MKIINKARLLGVFVLLIITLMACRSNLQEQILGQWKLGDENQDGGLIYSFKKDGQFTIWIEDIPVRGTYTWFDDQTIQVKLETNNANAEILGKVQIDGDQMKITNDQGDTDTLTRMK